MTYQHRRNPVRQWEPPKKEPPKGSFLILAAFGALILGGIYFIASYDPNDFSGAPDAYSNERTCTCSRYVNGKYAGDFQVKVGQMCGRIRCQ
jgi:hypothetical protein